MYSSQRTFSSEDLKRIAMLAMVTDHIGAVCIERTPLISVENWKIVDTVCRLTGRLAFPLFAFLLLQGFIYTRSRTRYLTRLFLLGLVSEIPFDLAVSGGLDFSRQNTCLLLAFGLGLLILMEKVPRWGQLLLALAAMAVSWVLRLDYSFMGILLICLLYWFQGDRRKQCTAGVLATIYELTAALAFFFVARYNGRAGEKRIPRPVWYLFYPVHLLVLYGVSLLIIKA